MKRTYMIFVTLMMVVVNVFGQDAFDFGFTNTRVQSRTVTVQPQTTTRTVSARALAQASARRNSSRSATATQQTASVPANTYTQTSNPELVAQAQAQAQAQQQVISGTIENVYNNGCELILTVRTQGLYGGEYRFALQGYNSNVEIRRSDFVCFVATFTGGTIPQVYANEFINPTGMKRYMNDYANMYYGGNYSMMLMQNGQMNKWQRAINTVTSTAMTVASLAALVKAIF